MTSTADTSPDKPRYGTLRDFVYDDGKGKNLQVEVSVKEDGRIAIFHNKPFRNELSWLEFDLSNNKLDFVLDDGETRDVGMALHPKMAKHMQNSHQVLLVLLDDDTGEAKEGCYIPLIIHQT